MPILTATSTNYHFQHMGVWSFQATYADACKAAYKQGQAPSIRSIIHHLGELVHEVLDLLFGAPWPTSQLLCLGLEASTYSHLLMQSFLG